MKPSALKPTQWAAVGLRMMAACLGGAAAGAGYAVATGVAIDARSRDWDMAGIPLVLAAIVFVGLLTGATAALCSRQARYVVAVLAVVTLSVLAGGAHDVFDNFTTQLTREERRELWASVHGLLRAGGPLGLPVSLWGGFLAHPHSERLSGIRNISLTAAGVICFFALIPACIHWLPRQTGIPMAGVLACVFALGLKRVTARR